MISKKYSVNFPYCLVVASILQSIPVCVLKGVRLGIESLARQVWLDYEGILAYFGLLHLRIVELLNSVLPVFLLDLVLFVLFTYELFLFFRNLQVHYPLADSQHCQPLYVHQTEFLSLLLDLLQPLQDRVLLFRFHQVVFKLLQNFIEFFQ